MVAIGHFGTGRASPCGFVLRASPWVNFILGHTCFTLWYKGIQVQGALVHNSCLSILRSRRRALILFVRRAQFSGFGNCRDKDRCAATHGVDECAGSIEFKGLGRSIPIHREGITTIVENIIGRRQSSACPSTFVRPKLPAKFCLGTVFA